MKVKTLIEELQRQDPEAEVRLNDPHGGTALFILKVSEDTLSSSNKDLKKVVWIEGKDDIDMGREIEAQFENASEEMEDELDFFMRLFLNVGFTLEDIKLYAPTRYEYCYNFMKEHGLL